jgi:hypothetical protein
MKGNNKKRLSDRAATRFPSRRRESLETQDKVGEGACTPKPVLFRAFRKTVYSNHVRKQQQPQKALHFR